MMSTIITSPLNTIRSNETKMLVMCDQRLNYETAIRNQKQNNYVLNRFDLWKDGLRSSSLTPRVTEST